MPVAVHLLLQRDGNILMLRRVNTGYEDGKWSVPAGHINAQESSTIALIREAQEELGIRLHNPQFAHLSHKKDPVDGQERLDLFFTCSKWDGTITNMEPQKCSDLKWYPFQELPSDTIGYVKNALDALGHGKTFSEFGWSNPQISEEVLKDITISR